jgi:hypothetical protein
MDTLFLNLSTNNREAIVLPCQTIEVIETVVEVKSPIVDNPKILLLEVKHSQINTLLDLTKMAACELWYFNKKQFFDAKSLYLQNEYAHRSPKCPHFGVFNYTKRYMQ